MKIITNSNDSFPPRTLSLPHVQTPTLSVVILFAIYYFAAKSVNGSLFQLHDPISYVLWFEYFYWFMTCCHEVISARHTDYIFLQFNAEMNQIVYSGRYRVTGAHMGSCAWEVALELQRDLNLLLFCRCGFLSSRERPNRCIFFSMFLFFHCCH